VAGEGIYVTGTLGDARAGLEQLRQDARANGPLVRRYLLPEPRVAFALAARGHMTAGLDISDGLSGDLRHLCRASGVGARIMTAALPRSAAFQADDLPLDWMVNGGDDYELVFTAPLAAEPALLAIAAACNTPLTRIGDTEIGSDIRWLDAQHQLVDLPNRAFQHF
jgi:thiamine-monophosphate kinase